MRVNRFKWCRTPVQRGEESPHGTIGFRRIACVRRARFGRGRRGCARRVWRQERGRRSRHDHGDVLVHHGQATGDQFNKLTTAFTKQTGIKVDVEEVNYADLPKAYEAAKLADKERDLVIENLTPDTTDWLPQGQVVDVRQYLDAWGITPKLDPAAVKYWTQGDSGVAGFPFIGFNWPVWYNMDLLKRAGVTSVPATRCPNWSTPRTNCAPRASSRWRWPAPSGRCRTSPPGWSSSSPPRRKPSSSSARAATAAARTPARASTCSPCCATKACSSTTRRATPPIR